MLTSPPCSAFQVPHAALRLLVAGMLAYPALQAAQVNDPASSASAKPAGLVLDQSFPWRMWPTYRPMEAGPRDQAKPADELAKAAGKKWSVFHLPTPGPGKDWMKPDFDDVGWRRLPGGYFAEWVGSWAWGASWLRSTPTKRVEAGSGNNLPKTLAALQFRGRFQVENPAAVTTLNLNLEYRGGVVVYLNGVEIARQHLPAGALEPSDPMGKLPLGDDYPMRQYALEQENKVPKAEQPAYYAERIRKLANLSIPTKHLVKGANVLAVAIYRTSWADADALLKKNREAFGSNGTNGWATCGFNRLQLTASPVGSIPLADAPRSDAHVWSAESIASIGDDLLQGDLLEPLRPIRLDAPRNGYASGQVAVSGPGPVTITAALGELKGPAGSLPVDAAKVRYAVSKNAQMQWTAPYCDVLLDQPPTDAQRVGVWVTVKVPATAKAGTYGGTLTVTLGGKATPVPVELTVADWVAPDPKDRWAFFDCTPTLQTYQYQYGVKPWSKEHIELMEQTMRYDADLSNRSIYIDVLRPAYLGNRAPQIVFTKDGSGFKPDFLWLDTYLDSWKKTHPYPPTYVMLMCHRGMMFEKRGVMPTTFGAWERTADGTLAPIDIPIFTDAAKPLWTAIIDGVKERIAKRGWKAESLHLAQYGDNVPPEPMPSFWNSVGKVPMHSNLHGTRRPWSVDPVFPGEIFGKGFDAIIGSWMDPTETKNRSVTCARNETHDYEDLQIWRGVMYAAVQGNYSGIGRYSLDAWPVTHPEKDKKGNVSIRPVLPEIHDAGNPRVPYESTPNHMLAPGPNGPLPTVRYELFRESIQDTEARIIIERILSDPAKKAKVPAALAEQALALIRATMAHRTASSNHYPRQGPILLELGPQWQDRVRALYALAGKVVAAAGP